MITHPSPITSIRRLVAVVAATVAMMFSMDLGAQRAAEQSRGGIHDPATLSEAWSLLAAGEADKARVLAADLLRRYPRSAAVLAFATDVELARAGATSALDLYERWLRQRTDAPYVLRVIARSVLLEIARTGQERSRRIEAIQALMAEDPAAAEGLLQAAGSTDPAMLALRGAAGDDQAIDALVGRLERPGPERHNAIVALGRTRSPRAAPLLVAALADPDPVIRGAAAEALGGAGGTQNIPDLRPLLDDPVVIVRMAAASALLALGDASGVPTLREQLASENPRARLTGARAMKSQAGAEWMAAVRELAGDMDPDVRRQAAELIAPHDAELARMTLEPLMDDPNPALRQAATDVYVRQVTGDFAVLRRYLRDADTGVRMRAADRILRLTR